MYPKLYNPKNLRVFIAQSLLSHGRITKTEKWQSVDGIELREILNVSYAVNLAMVDSQSNWGFKPNLPWADVHFKERVSGIPLNPPPSHEIWPHAQKSNNQFREESKFSHTYPERFWPKHTSDKRPREGNLRYGIRFLYGDLQDAIDLLRREPYTRQAYIPIWFPEDTGVVHGRRVPCSLGYHIQIRDGVAFMNYYMRSCDFTLHWEDDMYLAVKLLDHILDKAGLKEIRPGVLVCHIANLHYSPNLDYVVSKIARDGKDK